jgi:hypothetical protein
MDMGSDTQSIAAPAAQPGKLEHDLAKQVADKIWSECSSFGPGAVCTGMTGNAELSRTVNANLEKASRSNPSANAFLLATDLDFEVHCRQEAMLRAAREAGGVEKMSEVATSQRFLSFGNIHRIIDKRLATLKEPAHLDLSPRDCQ